MALHDEMVRLADTYPTEQEKSVYQDAAARFRLPYWDLIMPRNELKVGARRDTIWGFPEVFKNSHVFVRQPGRDQDTDEDGYNLIPNPLFTFKFPTQEEHDKSGRIRLNMEYECIFMDASYADLIQSKLLQHQANHTYTRPTTECRDKQHILRYGRSKTSSR